MDYDVSDIAKQISLLKKDAINLKQKAKGIPAVECNIDRILASIKMLEINISDIVGL
jgi:hypothetical protein